MTEKCKKTLELSWIVRNKARYAVKCMCDFQLASTKLYQIMHPLKWKDIPYLPMEVFVINNIAVQTYTDITRETEDIAWFDLTDGRVRHTILKINRNELDKAHKMCKFITNNG